MRFLLAFLAIFSLFFTACADKQPTAMEQRIAQKITFEGLEKDIVKDFNYRTNANGLLEVQVSLLHSKPVEYKLSWLDEDGFALKAPTDGEYIKLKLKKGKEFLLQRVATNKEAVDFRLILRKID